MRRTLLVTTAAALLAAAAVAPVSAHSSAPEVRVVMDDLPDELDGIQAQVVVSVEPQLVVANPTDRRLEILSDDGRAFLRLDAAGVEADLGTRDWYATNDPLGSAALPAEVRDGDVEPMWRTVSQESSWGWYDHRLHPGPLRPPPEVVEAGEPAQLGTWQVPVRFGGVETALTGTVEYRPRRGSFAYDARLDPAVPGVALQVLPGQVPGLFLANETGQEIVVLGADREPFLRFRDGRVEANRASPSWVAVSRAEGDSPTVAADPDRPPAWEPVATSARKAWIEPRAAYGAFEPPADVLALGVAARVDQWTIPMRVGGQEVRILGTTTWVPAQPGDAVPEEAGVSADAVAVAAVIGLVVGYAVLRRRDPARATTDGA